MLQEEVRKRKAEADARQPVPSPSNAEPSFLATLPARAKAWTATGVISCRDVDLSTLGLPRDEILNVAASGPRRLAIDLHGCRLGAIDPPSLWSDLTQLRKLRLSGNALSDASIGWEALLALPSLEQLVLDGNAALTQIPEGISRLASLQVLSAKGCGIVSAPGSLARLPALRTLQLSENQLASPLPDAWREAASLEELYLCGNKIDAIPDTWGSLGKLRVLQLDGNRIRSVPSSVLRGCTSLVLLSLYDNPIVIEELRGSDGFAEYNARRISQVDKQLDSRVKANLNEGADFAREEWGGY